MAKLQDITKNPLNIRYSKYNNWLGQIGQERGFCKFSHLGYGFRAAHRLLENYIKSGTNTISAIIRKWAPTCENDTEAYIKFVSEDCMIHRDYKLRTQTIHDYWTLIMIIRAMAKMECGKWYEEQEINLYINYPEKFNP